MLDHLLGRLKFRLERLVQRGALVQLLLMAILIALVAILGGLFAWALTPNFDNPLVAIWWAFLRLTDPGYLGDDEGAVLRIISTVVTVLGYVLFMGSLIAIMTQWLARTIRHLESGLTPIVMKDHVVILGWTNRTPETVAQLVRGRGRLQRFLDRRHISTLRIVVLADEVDAARRFELREYLGPDWTENQVFLRSGSSLHPPHLARTDLMRASVVLVPGADFAHGGAELNDTRVVKTLLTIEAMLEDVPAPDRPHVVAEIFDPLKATLARSCVHGPMELIASDQVISRIIYQSVRHPDMVRVLLDLFTHRKGNSLYLRSFPAFSGRSVRAVHEAFASAIVLGVLRTRGDEPGVHLDPTCDLVLEPDDLLILLGERYDTCLPSDGAAVIDAPSAPGPAPEPAAERNEHAILLLGWSHKLGPLLAELDALGGRRFDVTVMSKLPIADREAQLEGVQYSDRIRVRHVRGDYASARALQEVDPVSFASIVFLASGWMRSSEEADARTILGYLLLQSLLADVPNPPDVLVELLDPDNGPLLGERENAVLVSPRILSHLLAHVALRPELNAVLDALLGAGGAELGTRDAAAFGLLGRTVTFREVQHAALGAGCVAVGVSTGSPRTISVNPDRARPWTLAAGDLVIVLELCAPAASRT